HPGPAGSTLTCLATAVTAAVQLPPPTSTATTGRRGVLDATLELRPPSLEPPAAPLARTPRVRLRSRGTARGGGGEGTMGW
ncbi:hypothetical protein A7K94_0217315, partial [Modestobacter sp. VKM Ac-2676]